MGPKYLLVFEAGQAPYAIYEQIASYILTDEMRVQTVVRPPPVISQRIYSRHYTLELALKELSELNDNEPVLLAYSNKPIDNTFKV